MRLLRLIKLCEWGPLMVVVTMEKERLELPPHSISQHDGLHGVMVQQKALNRGCPMSLNCPRSCSRSCYPVCGTQLREQLLLHSPSYLSLPLDLATVWHSIFCPASLALWMWSLMLEVYLPRGMGTLVTTLFLHVFLSSDKTPLDMMIRGFQCTFTFFTNATCRKAKFSIFAPLGELPSLLCLLSDSFQLPFFQPISY